MRKGHLGASMGGSTVLSPKRAAARARARSNQEAAWAAKSGPVTITYKAQTPEQVAINQEGLAAARSALKK